MRERFLLSVNTWLRAMFVCSFSTVFGACTAGQSIQQRLARPPEAVSPQPAEATPLVYYAGADQLIVYSEPRSSASQLAQLPLHQKVYRYKMEKGYAYIKVEGNGVSGWVDNARLIWRLPSQRQEAATKTQEQTVEPAQEAPVANEQEQAVKPAQEAPVANEQVSPPTAAVEAAEPEPVPTVVEAPAEQEPSSPAAAPTSVSPEPPPLAAPSAPRPINPSIFNPF